MSERKFGYEPTPHLTPAEVVALKDLVKNFGSVRQADYPELETNTNAYFYTLDANPETIDNYNDRLPENGNQAIIGVRIEYNDQMEDLDGYEIESAVAVEVKSVVRLQGEPSRVREMRYLFLLDFSRSVVVQDITEGRGQVNVQDDTPVDQLSDVQLAELLSPRYLQLTSDDVQLLRFLISHL